MHAFETIAHDCSLKFPSLTVSFREKFAGLSIAEGKNEISECTINGELSISSYRHRANSIYLIKHDASGDARRCGATRCKLARKKNYNADEKVRSHQRLSLISLPFLGERRCIHYENGIAWNSGAVTRPFNLPSQGEPCRGQEHSTSSGIEKLTEFREIYNRTLKLSTLQFVNTREIECDGIRGIFRITRVSKDRKSVV